MTKLCVLLPLCPCVVRRFHAYDAKCGYSIASRAVTSRVLCEAISCIPYGRIIYSANIYPYSL